MDKIQAKLLRLIEEHKDEIVSFAEDIFKHPEPGFYEERTAAKVAGFFRALGMEVHTNLARTGVRGDWMEQDGPNVTVIGEMDAIGCRTHPMADPVTGVAHACGHHAQIAAMIGAALALADEEVRASLSGSVSFFAVPAEEYVEAGKRKRLKEEGIGFPGSGKSELIRIGAFDKTDIAMTTHVHMVPTAEDFYLGNPPCNGYAAEVIAIEGKAAHAAVAPWEGVNALSIASSALNMIGLMRETFREEEHVRLHNIITKGGEVINSVPDQVVLQSKMRAATLNGIQDAKEKVERAFDGAAYAFGGKIRRERLQGYMPILPRKADKALVEAAKELNLDYRLVQEGDFNNACTDVGDLTHLMPVVNFTFGGFQGSLHGADFQIADPKLAYITSAKLMALTIYHLLKDNGKEAKDILKDFHPAMTKEEYIRWVTDAAY